MLTAGYVKPFSFCNVSYKKHYKKRMRVIYSISLSMLRKRFILFVLLSLVGIQAIPQSNGGIDPSFITGSGFNNVVRTVALQSDGKIVIGGDFTSYNGTSRNRIVRVNPDGTIDNSFSIGTGFNRSVNSIVVQPDGKIIVAGVFTTYKGLTQNRIIRLNTDGSLDNTFSIGSGCNNDVNTIAYQSDGKIILAGDFTRYNNLTRNRVVRIYSNGVIDNTFSIGSGFSNTVNLAAIQTDGSVIFGGNFTSYNGTTRNRIIRLTSTGAIDNTFSIGTGFNMEVIAITLQSDNKILVGGSFTSFAGNTRNRIVRLNSNGSIDNTFTIGSGFNNTVRVLSIQPDGLILAGGNFTTFNGSASNRIIRLTSTGGIDGNFITGTGFSGLVRTIILQSNGWAVVGGSFTNYNGSTSNNVARIDGYVCPPSVSLSVIPGNSVCTGTEVTLTAQSLNGGSNPTYQWFLNSAPVGTNTITYSSSTLNNDDQIYVTMTSSSACASFATVQSEIVTMSVSTTVTPSVVITANPEKIVCAGTDISFNAMPESQGLTPAYQWYVNGTPVGANSTGFSSNTLNNNDRVTLQLTSSEVCAEPKTVLSNALTIQVAPTLSPSVSIAASSTNICQGSSVTYTATATDAGANPTYNFLINGITKQSGVSNLFTSTTINNNDIVSCLLSNAVPGNQGTLDASFSIGSGFNGLVETVINQTDGKLIIAGDFTTYKGVTRNRIVRLNSDGSIDNTFSIGTGFNRIVHALAIQEDGKIIVAGNFTTYNGTSRNRIIRLNANGSLDNTFSIGTGFYNDVWTLAIQPDGKIIAGGDFTSYNGTSRNRLVRISTTGTLDNTFGIGTGFSSTVNVITLQSDGKILVGGDFTSYNGTSKNRIIRLNTNGSDDNTLSIGSGFNQPVLAFAIQPDNRILIGGEFSTYNGTTRNRLVRINSDGSIDNTLAIGTGFNNIVRSIKIQTNDMIIVGGDFTSYNGTTKNRIIRIDWDGTIDNNLILGSGFGNSVYSLRILSNGYILAAGNFTNYSGSSISRLARIQNALCFNTTALSNSISMTVNSNVSSSVSIVPSPGNVICQGKEITFTATPVNGGTTPHYQWYLNGNPVGSNSTTYQNNSLVSNDQVYISMVSSMTCATPASANSNTVTITANTGCGLDSESQASVVQTTTNNTRSMTINWNDGYWDKRVVFVKQSDVIELAVPVNGTAYTANSTFGQGTQIGSSGWYCVFNGSGSSVSITGLRPYTQYQTMVIEYFGNPGSEVYNLSSAINNPSTLVTLGVVPEDFNALKAIYKSLNGSSWTAKWDTLTNSVSTKVPWSGIVVGPYDPGNGVDLEDRIVQISLQSNKLSGSLPKELGDLTELRLLNLSKNSLTGEIPAEIGNLSNLTYLNLNNNKLNGAIPAAIGNLTNLTNIHLAYNSLVGEIPIEIGNLINLVELVLSNNLLTGSIPNEIANLSKLTRLGLPNNQLTGSIPTSIGNMTSLTRCVLSFNNLTGSIPQEIGYLTNLTSLGLVENQLSGELPASLGNLINLTELNLYRNQFTGSIPAEIGNLTKLQTLNLNDNNFSGSVPETFSNLQNLKKLNLSKNNLTTLPDLSHINFDMVSGSGLIINNNRFTFYSLIPIRSKLPYSTQYNPQKAFDLNMDTLMYISGNTISIDVISLSVNNLGSNNLYWLYKGNKVIQGPISSGTFTLENVTINQSGTYNIKVANNQLSGLSLWSIPLVIEIAQSPQKTNENIVDSSLYTYGKLELSAYPNPTSRDFSLQVNGDYQGEINITIYNNLGQQLSSQISSKPGGDISFDMAIDGSAGLYYLEVKTPTRRNIIKIVKQ